MDVNMDMEVIFLFPQLCFFLTRNSLIAVVSPLDIGWKTARQRHVPQIANRINACEMAFITSISFRTVVGNIIFTALYPVILINIAKILNSC